MHQDEHLHAIFPKFICDRLVGARRQHKTASTASSMSAETCSNVSVLIQSNLMRGIDKRATSQTTQHNTMPMSKILLVAAILL